MTKKNIIIFDTTLRDGEQSPGATLNCNEKLLIARQLFTLGVDICEAGFPVASQGDFDAVKKIADTVGTTDIERPNGPMCICALARTHKKDILLAYEAIKNAKRKRIHTFLATSDIHLKHKLNITRDDCVDKIHNMVSYAYSLCKDVEFSPEDACRTDLDFLVTCVQVAIDAGATTINIPDTVGYITPNEMFNIIEHLIKNVNNSEKITWSTHCHNDLGLATANTLSGILAGARQVEVTMNGIGERAGNTSLEEIVMTLYTRPKIYNVTTNINTTEIIKTSRMVSSLTGMIIQPNKAIVGINAFSHEAGIHQHGVIKHERTYEIISPHTVGLNTNNIVLGKHSGKHAFKKKIIELGYSDIDDKSLIRIVTNLKNLADKKKFITDQDIEALVVNNIKNIKNCWKLLSMQVNSTNDIRSMANISMMFSGNKIISKQSTGAGPINALYNCINKIVKSSTTLENYKVDSITSGFDALGRVTIKIIEIENKNKIYTGYSTHHDIMFASANAYINALNKML